LDSNRHHCERRRQRSAARRAGGSPERRYQLDGVVSQHVSDQLILHRTSSLRIMRQTVTAGGGQSARKPRVGRASVWVRCQCVSFFMRLPYAPPIFLSSALLFLLQPVAAKAILPSFGGSAGVWTACMLFFQAVLLLGYAYAYCITRYLSSRSQTMVHLALLALSLALLPV